MNKFKPNTGIMDAFLELSMMDDDDILLEGKSYNLNNKDDIDAADKFLEEDATKEVALEVIDVDADAIDHLKNEKEYIGQMLLQCNACKATVFKDVADLDETDGNEGLYNVDDECPHCHAVGNGYTLIGQVGKVAEDEPTIENDEHSDEARVENDGLGEEETVEEEPVGTEETEEGVFDEEPETDGMETTGEDDTADMEDTTGEDIDADDVNFDDTEEKPVEEDLEEDNTFAGSLDDEEKSDETKEDEESEEDEEKEFVVPTIEEFITRFIVDPEEMVIKVLKDGEEVFNGKFEDITHDVKTSKIGSFKSTDGVVTVNVSEPEDERTPVSDILRTLVKDDDNSVMFMKDDEDYEPQADDSVITIEKPTEALIEIFVEDEEKTAEEPKDKDIESEDDLTEAIIKANHLSMYRVNNNRTNEWFINESIKDKEDLNSIYTYFVLPTQDAKLVEAFKKITGYKDALDEAKERFDVFKEPVVEQVVEEVKEQPIVEEKVSEVKETVSESIKSFKTRKELSEALAELRAAGTKYTVRRSVVEGYRYDLITEGVGCCEDPVAEHEDPVAAPEEVEAVAEEVSVPVEVVSEPSVEVIDDVEVLDPVAEPEDVDTTAIVPEGMTDEDVEIVNKLMRISTDIKTAIEDTYGIECDERLILADMVQDLRLVSGSLRPEEIEDTPINQLTKKMYQAYNGFYEALDDMMSFVTGRRITTSQADKLHQAVASLDSESFSTEGIRQQIASDRFLTAARAGAIPYIGADEVRALEMHEEVVKEDVEVPFEDLISDGTVKVGKYTVEEFESKVQEYLDESCEETVIYTTESVKEEEGKYIVEGVLDSEDSEGNKITFTCEPTLNEELDETTLTVTNDLTEDVIKM